MLTSKATCNGRTAALLKALFFPRNDQDQKKKNGCRDKAKGKHHQDKAAKADI